jgi:RNA polymerase sigma-70 factor (ECF subfamily)
LQSDAELVKAVLDGDKRAFEVLVKRYERPIRAIALEILGDYHLAWDVSQDSFVTAYENLPSLRKPVAFGSWLMKITRRCALDCVRRKNGQSSLEPVVSSRSHDRNGRLDEEKQWLLSAVIKLPKGERQVIMLRYFSSHSVKEVVDILGRSVGTVTKQLSRAHKRLRNILERSQNGSQR